LHCCAFAAAPAARPAAVFAAPASLAAFLPLSQVKVGAPFYSQAWHGLKYGASNMGLLVSLGTTAAFAYSLATMLLCALDASYMGHVYFESSVLILVFVCLGKYLEAMAKARTSDAVRSLMQLAPKTAELVVYGGPEGRRTTETVQQIDTRLVKVQRCERVGGRAGCMCVFCQGPACIVEAHALFMELLAALHV
jgi:Cu+-exporting ATPase